MKNFRNIGYFVDSHLEDNKLRTAFCETLNFSSLDLDRLCEGRLGLSPVQLEKAASFFKVPASTILNYENTDSYANKLHFGRLKFALE